MLAVYSAFLKFLNCTYFFKKYFFEEIYKKKFLGYWFKLNNDTLYHSSHNLGKQDMMTFEDLKEMLDEFENYLPEEEKEMAQVIQAEIESNG